jgi:hypothetical protein
MRDALIQMGSVDHEWELWTSRITSLHVLSLDLESPLQKLLYAPL